MTKGPSITTRILVERACASLDRAALGFWALRFARERRRFLRYRQSVYLVAGEPARWTMRRP